MMRENKFLVIKLCSPLLFSADKEFFFGGSRILADDLWIVSLEKFELYAQTAAFASGMEAKAIWPETDTNIAAKNRCIKADLNRAYNFNMNDFLTFMSKDKT